MRKELKKWKEIDLEDEKKFNYLTVIDFRLVKSINEKKMKELRKRKPITMIASGGGGEAVVPKKVRVSLVTWRPIGSMASYKTPCLTSH